MLSKEMYIVLKQIPRYPKEIHCSELYISKKTDKELLKGVLCDAASSGYDYINKNGYQILDSKLSLTERGVAAIEAHEGEKSARKWMIWSSLCAFIAMVAARASAAAAFLALKG